MARQLDHIPVGDVEATCWQGEPPPGQNSEIIEIGLCLLEVATLARVERRRRTKIDGGHTQRLLVISTTSGNNWIVALIGLTVNHHWLRANGLVQYAVIRPTRHRNPRWKGTDP